MDPERTDLCLSEDGVCKYTFSDKVTNFKGDVVVVDHTEHIDFTKVHTLNAQDDNGHPNLTVKYIKDPWSTHRIYMPRDVAEEIACLFEDYQTFGKCNKKRIKIGYFVCYFIYYDLPIQIYTYPDL